MPRHCFAIFTDDDMRASAAVKSCRGFSADDMRLFWRIDQDAGNRARPRSCAKVRPDVRRLPSLEQPSETSESSLLPGPPAICRRRR